jgi:hypothetical protein
MLSLRSVSLIVVFISLSICLLLFPSSLLLEDPPVLELFQNGFVLSSDVLPFSLSLWLLSFFRFGSFGMPSLSCPLPFAYHLSLTNEKHLKNIPLKLLHGFFLHFFRVSIVSSMQFFLLFILLNISFNIFQHFCSFCATGVRRLVNIVFSSFRLQIIIVINVISPRTHSLQYE